MARWMVGVELAFFFQAEDGIRDIGVTGVQTCALPISAQRRGVAGLLLYSDPADDGFKKGKTYPDGPWGPESHIQRGGIVYDFLVPGGPLTPGWPSLPGARRIAARDAVSLPKIMSVPLSWKDARPILEALKGPEAPAAWQGGLPFTYHVGGRGQEPVRGQ